MSDGEVAIKAVATIGDAMRSMASIERELEKVQSQLAGANSKAKQDAIAAKQAAQERQKAEVEGARKIRQAERQLQADKREERQRTEREQVRAQQKSERDERESRGNTQRLSREAERQKQADAREAARAKSQLEREATRESKQQEREKTREATNAAGERKRIVADESREKARIVREGERDRKRRESEELRAASQMKGWIGGLVGVQAGYQLITGTIKEALDFQKELIQLTDEQGRAQDRRTRTFAVNAGLNDQDAAVAAAGINAVAVETGISAERLEPAASEMAGSEFHWKAASGPGLKAAVHATGVTGGGDIGEAAGAFGLTLNAAGLEKTTENIERIGKAIFGLRGKSRMETRSLKFLASELSIANNQSLEDNLALDATFLDVTDDSKAAGAFGSFQRRMRAPNAEVKKALALGKVDPKKVDFVNEGTEQVVDTLATAYAGLPDDRKGEFIKGIAGGDYLGQVDHLLKHPERFKELRKSTDNKAGYQEAVKQKFSGLAFAADSTAEERRQELAAQTGSKTTEADQRAIARRRSGMSEFRADFTQKRGEWARYAGLDPTVGEKVATFLTNPSGLPGFAPGSVRDDPNIYAAGEAATQDRLSGVVRKRPSSSSGRSGLSAKELAELDQFLGLVNRIKPMDVQTEPALPAGEKAILPAVDPNAPKSNFPKSNFPFLSGEERDRANREREAKFRGEKPFAPFAPLSETSDFSTDIDDEEAVDDQASHFRGGGVGSRLAEEFGRNTEEVAKGNRLLEELVSLSRDSKPTAVKEPSRRARAVNASETS